MDRKEAIEYAKFRLECHTKGDGEYTDYGEFLVAAIAALQEPKVGGWIPVSERLPEEPNYYEVTVDFGSEQITEVVFYSICESRWGAYNNDITAWRERLQEPYKAGEQK